MKRSKYYAALALSSLVLVAACTPVVTTMMVTVTPNSMSTPVIVMITATPSPTSTPAPEITLYYEGYAQFELISPEGRRVLIDVADPDWLTSPATEQDILLTTHGHEDHFDREFASSFPGQEIRIREGEFNLPDVTIRGIASAHSPNETPVPEGGSNYIFIIDMAGMRFAHFGDIGQEELSQEQLDALGEVDVAMILFGGTCSQSDDNSFNLVDQFQPKLIIPTHAAMASLERATEAWEAYYGDPWVFASDKTGVAISPSDLSDETKFLMSGQWAVMCGDAYSLPEWQ
jgi:hypothetical protein